MSARPFAARTVEQVFERWVADGSLAGQTSLERPTSAPPLVVLLTEAGATRFAVLGLIACLVAAGGLGRWQALVLVLWACFGGRALRGYVYWHFSRIRLPGGIA